ncbi:PIN domain-containing protein [Sinorhizobium meliloti]|uniref:PIN domain-containing protein n=1 Tax=Rhizobium meliloti TaxID=382 RepID=UPI000485A3A0|nr:PIN domain-containing protein [Sinorhizobium meliloti]MDW9419012.1 hypothetical protein [Sinorhizobium meliloti]MDW9515524.1 hypothetical protein [Sinorhizobium meliloti]MDX0061181.1 hypothetical protein [Sinorhizobium meliloti]MDX0378511.1 hypothetical protein [Sinorhizobium meliloti]UFX12821.1 PIN domain-containing protein [Sinorhizobium meliloti]
MTSPSDVGAEIARRGTPVVFIDTCSILDLIRGPRDKFSAQHAASGVALLELCEKEATTLVLPQQVIEELTANLEERILDGRRGVDKLNLQLSEINAIVKAYGQELPDHTNVSGTVYAEGGRAVVERFQEIAIVAGTTDNVRLRAMDRVSASRAPAKRGKDSLQDCVVLETCYETIDHARRIGFAAPAHFLSANVDEYLESKGRLQPVLISEFGNRDLHFWDNFAALRYTAGIREL